MLVSYLRSKATAEDAECKRALDMFREIGLVPSEVRSAEALERRVSADDCEVWAHFIGLSAETATDVMQRDRRYPAKVCVLVGTVSEMVRVFRQPLGDEDFDLLVTLVGFENPARQLKHGIPARLVKQWIRSVRDEIFGDQNDLPPEMQSRLESLFVLQPFKGGSRRGEKKESEATERRFESLLTLHGLNSPAQIRKCSFALLMHVCVTQFGIPFADAVRACGARDVRSAEKKVRDVLAVKDLKEAWLLSFEDVMGRVLRSMFVDVARASQVRSRISVPQAFSDWAGRLDQSDCDEATNAESPLSDTERRKAGTVMRTFAALVRSVVTKSLGELGGAADIEDAMQEAFAAMSRNSEFRQMLRERPTGQDTWGVEERVRLLAGIARGVASNHKRTLASKMRRDLPFSADGVSDGEVVYGPSTEDPHRDAEHAEWHAKLAEAVDSLGADAQLVRLRIEGWGWSEIGEKLGITADAAEHRFSRRRPALKERLRGFVSG